ncbi:MAG: hypothetical protein IJB84_01815 [Lachnospiraceae bacterium]|nr:hypothetical protein [Lachnospiraceae bacterium]
MKFQNLLKSSKKIAFVLSLCTILLWTLLGTGTSLAWFVDTAKPVTNMFYFADFDLEVSHRLPNGTWAPVDNQTKLFDEEALYEPGYTQVIYLKVDNLGDCPFLFHTAVSITSAPVPATNVYGDSFYLQDYIKFGLMQADSEAELLAGVANRDLAKDFAVMTLRNYSTEVATLKENGTKYIALVVFMPEDVGNEANYRGGVIPKVTLGLTVSAEQLKN